jgi:hypothetical protein
VVVIALDVSTGLDELRRLHVVSAKRQLLIKRRECCLVAKKNERPQVRTYRAGLEDEFPNGPPTTVVEHRGFELVLRFGEGDLAGEGPVREIWIRPDTLPLESGALQLMPSASQYFRLARSHMALLGSDEGTPEERFERFYQALEPFRKVAGPGRALGDPFYRLLGEQYKGLVESEYPHPVKTLADIHQVKISTASKWLKEARRRGYPPEKEAKVDAS